MSPSRVLLFAAAVALVVLVLAALVSGSKGASGFALGVAGASLNLWALKGAIGLLAKAPEKERLAKFAAAFVVVAFFAKIPVFLGLWVLAGRIGHPATTWFLIGIGLVYSTLVGWSLALR